MEAVGLENSWEGLIFRYLKIVKAESTLLSLNSLHRTLRNWPFEHEFTAGWCSARLQFTSATRENSERAEAKVGPIKPTRQLSPRFN